MCPRPTAGRSRRATGASCRASLRWAVVNTDSGRVAPIWDAERQLLFVGDVRLYDRGALSRALEIGVITGDLSDAEIAWRAYLRWGEEDSPKHLVGDFAFAVWDERKRSVFGARDHFGIRPLYYSVDSRRAFVASDVRQLLAVTPQPAANIDAQAILERFSRGVRNDGRTFFRNISALPAGHTATIVSGRCHCRRYWLPSFEPNRGVAADDRFTGSGRCFTRLFAIASRPTTRSWRTRAVDSIRVRSSWRPMKSTGTSRTGRRW